MPRLKAEIISVLTVSVLMQSIIKGFRYAAIQNIIIIIVVFK